MLKKYIVRLSSTEGRDLESLVSKAKVATSPVGNRPVTPLEKDLIFVPDPQSLMK